MVTMPVMKKNRPYRSFLPLLKSSVIIIQARRESWHIQVYSSDSGTNHQAVRMLPMRIPKAGTGSCILSSTVIRIRKRSISKTALKAYIPLTGRMVRSGLTTAMEPCQ